MLVSVPIYLYACPYVYIGIRVCLRVSIGVHAHRVLVGDVDDDARGDGLVSRRDCKQYPSQLEATTRTIHKVVADRGNRSES